MGNNQSNHHRQKEGEVNKGAPEATPNAGNIYEDDDSLSGNEKPTGHHDDLRRDDRLKGGDSA